MGSPFTTADEYLNATGTLHSFTGHPGLSAIFIIASCVLTVYFLYKAFTIQHY
jgi:hypothetical protein